MKACSFNYILMVMVAIFFSACDKDPVIPNEEELITTFLYVLTPSGGGDVITLHFNDPDGDGGLAPVVVGGILQSNQSYTGVISLSNTSVVPFIDISEEILEEGIDHQFFFIPENVNVQVAYGDSDSNAHPIGLASTLVTGTPSEGTLKIILRHLPDKTAPGVNTGSIENAGGETDIEVTFPLRIE